MCGRMWSIIFIVACFTADAFGQNDAGNCELSDDEDSIDCKCEEGYFKNFEDNCEKNLCASMNCGANQNCTNNKCDCLPGFQNVANGGPKQCVRPITTTLPTTPLTTTSTTPLTQPTTLLTTPSTTPLTQPTTLVTHRTITTTMTPPTAAYATSGPPMFVSTEGLNTKLSMLGIWDITGVLILVACLSGYVGYACHRRRYGAYLLAPPNEQLNGIQIRQ